MAAILTHPQQSLPLLKQAYASAGGKDKLTYAKALAVMGDATGLDELLKAVDATKWDKGWNYTGMGQFGSSLSELDTMIVALGRTKDRRAVPVILKKLEQLDARSEFSHHRAVALALEAIGDASAAGPLANLLNKPGMRGWVHATVEQARRLTGNNPNDTTTRSTSIRELSLARALYRCGDKDGLGRMILMEYTKDLRGHLARHARAVLDEKR
jgi:HEAT repeat protein